ncbi:MAG: type II secretion system ATPase GspE [Chlamydiota bacterium]
MTIGSSLIDILKQHGKVPEDTPSGPPEQLVERGMISQSDLQAAYAEHFGMEIVTDLSSYQLPREFYVQVPYAFAKKNSLIPIQKTHSSIIVAIADPLNLDALDELRMMLGQTVKAVYSTRDAILAAIDECYRQESGVASELMANLRDQSITDLENGDIEVYDLLEDGEQAPIIRLLNLIISEAIHQGASDIHFEPFEGGMRVRYRIDGVLQDRHSPDYEYQSQLITRLKVMAKLDIAERRLPQDGRIKLRMGGREIDFRVSTVPVVNGERIVMRILDKGSVTLGLEKLGMGRRILEDFKKATTLPEGIVLVTGPTGSGKTTTLYSALYDILTSEVNIMTIEDPVEYKIAGIAQIAVKPKINLNFADGLRHILRQDPDIIMVGEIRDRETAEIAIQASLTGHMVLSTLHTNDAPSAITRLVDMGIEPYLISSSVAGVLAQRLVRRICPECAWHYQPTSHELEQLGLSEDDVPEQGFFKGAGCSNCYGTGYKGRHGIYEFLPIDEPIRKQFIKNPDAADLRHLARERGMHTLREHAAGLVCQGITTVAEVLRVSRGA